jgi:Dyp-type peroxidase family
MHNETKMNRLDFISTKDLSYEGPEFLSIANDIQGNILKGHARKHVTLVFFTFKPNLKVEAQSWLHTFGTRHLTTAAKQKQQAIDRRENNVESLFYGLYLTSTCYDYLGLNAKKPNDKQFRQGMAASQKDLEDPNLSAWESNWQKGEIHGCVLIAYGAEREKLDLMAQFVKEELADFADTFEEIGYGLQNEAKDDIEHFGYVDGISQPRFFKEDLDKIPHSVWNPSASWDLVLSVEPDQVIGSYWVFRKLEQNVKLFKTHEHELGVARGLKGDDAEIVGAEIVGRWENGMPRTLGTDDVTIGDYTIDKTTIGKINNFNYKTDPDKQGIRCPYHAHVRKVNPRDGDIKQHLIARRGIPYGGYRTPESLENAKDIGPTEGVGLLFQCFQKDIGAQFENMQKAANDTQKSPKDPIIGCPAHNEFVKLKGGGYFFAPSLSFFENLNPILSLQNLIEDMNPTPTKGIMGNFTDANPPLPVYYAKMVSHVILEQLRNDIEDIVDAKLKQAKQSGTRNQVIEILTSRDAELTELLRKAAKINNWYETEHPKAAQILSDRKLVEGGNFEFVPNKYHPPVKTANGKVPGEILVQCADGVCCTTPQSPNSMTFMVPSSITQIANANLEYFSENKLWHIFETTKGSTICVNIEGEDFSFIA